MTTDTALGVTKLVVEDKGSLPTSVPVLRLTSIVHISAFDGHTIRRTCDGRFRLCPVYNFSTQDYPTIVFNSKESVEMPFRESVNLTYAHLES